MHNTNIIPQTYILKEKAPANDVPEAPYLIILVMNAVAAEAEEQIPDK